MYNNRIRSPKFHSILKRQSKTITINSINPWLKQGTQLLTQLGKLGRLGKKVGAKRVCPGILPSFSLFSYLHQRTTSTHLYSLLITFVYIHLVPPQWLSFKKSKTSTSSPKRPQPRRITPFWPRMMKMRIIPILVSFIIQSII